MNDMSNIFIDTIKDVRKLQRISRMELKEKSLIGPKWDIGEIARAEEFERGEVKDYETDAVCQLILTEIELRLKKNPPPELLIWTSKNHVGHTIVHTRLPHRPKETSEQTRYYWLIPAEGLW